jgi:hypothetical protein
MILAERARLLLLRESWHAIDVGIASSEEAATQK